MQNILRQNHDIFAWAHSDMKGIHPSIASHRLNVFSTARPVQQKIRRFHPDRQKVIRNEIDKLLESGFIREVAYPDWLANMVVVPKKEGKWWVCVDYTNLNNACPKDSFPLPRIDQIVDSTAGQGMLSFLDAFSGYHQIPMSPDDEEKTAFITPHDLYCYKVMPFGLKNVGATYQRLMTKIFKPLIGHTVEEIWHEAESFQMRLWRKCWQISGFYGEPKRIEVSPDQIKAVMETPPPRNKKELQRLTGKLVALRRFIARFTDELRPFFLAIRKAGTHGWTDKWAISVVLFRCPSPKEQKPIYYVSRALADVETRYSKMELTALALRSAAQKLRPYFQAHPNIPEDPAKHHESSKQEWWTLRVDGASRSSGSGVGLLLQSPTGEHLEQAIRLGFSASNNEAEYEAILSGLDLALTLSVSKLRIYSDSQLVQFTEWTIEKIKRADNRRADALAGIAASSLSKKPFYCLYIISPDRHSTRRSQAGTQSPGASCPFHPDWGAPYKRSFTGPYLRCLGHSKAQYVLAELHEGICGIIREDDL
ncbi:Transposon Ty3-I Gag-Pol polyprotein [Vitis vinifera]|uniref:Transposon Ty3-I Gag-Pol polyprotein n=1 Tax=Vitis vinifera TaxID=29760 RepID=A0A438CXL7_VITVI|nr:Transposon Ty3-I Gag-Pol polyprotein [Vitis vinifera]